MQLAELIAKRRSVRRYLPDKVDRTIIDKCIEAARLAPSACNSQPWHFLIVDDEPLRSIISSKIFSGAYSMNSFACKAPALIFVIRKRSSLFAMLGGILHNTRYNLIDIGIATEHFVLQAEELGLGTCWLGWFNERAAKKHLGLSIHDKIDIVISLGYSSDSNTAEKMRKDTEQIRSYK